jgi:hypothetical protein
LYSIPDHLDVATSIKVVDSALEINDIEVAEPIRLKLPFEIFTQEAYADVRAYIMEYPNTTSKERFLHVAQVPVQIEYTTKKRPEYKRQLRSTLKIRLALPLSVNVQDFLRDDLCVQSLPIGES